MRFAAFNQYGLSNNINSNQCNGNNPSSFNQSIAIPPKMHINVDEHGNQLNDKMDAIRSEIIENKQSVVDKAKENPNSALGQAELNARAAEENGKLASQAWDNLFGGDDAKK